MKSRLQIFAVFLSLQSLAWSTLAFDRVDFEGGYSINKEAFYDGYGTLTPMLYAPETSVIPQYRYIRDVDTQFDTWIQAGGAGNSPTALALMIFSNQNENVKDKIELSVLRKAVDLVEKGQRRYFSFDLKFDAKYQTPKAWLLHFQAFQPGAGSPPFAMYIEPNDDPASPIVAVFAVTDYKYNPLTDVYDSFKREIYRQQLPRNKWNRLTFQLQPSASATTASGQIAIWYDGVLKKTYKADWGCPIGVRTYSAQKNVYRISEGYLDFSVGIYRRRQTTTQLIYVDNLQVTGSYAELIP